MLGTNRIKNLGIVKNKKDVTHDFVYISANKLSFTYIYHTKTLQKIKLKCSHQISFCIGEKH